MLFKPHSVALIGGLALLCGTIIAKNSDNFRKILVIFPKDKSIIRAKEISLICELQREIGEKPKKPPKILVNGLALQWDSKFELPTLVAHVKLSPGLNEIQIEGVKLSVYLALDKAKEPPKGLRELYFHPPSSSDRQLECSLCHSTEKRDGRLRLEKAPVPNSCDRCHSELEFELKHHHPKQPIEQCNMCHSIHGSNIKGLLKKPSKQLCAECHD